MSLTFEFLQLTQATFRLILSSCRCPRPDAEAGDSSEDGVGAILSHLIAPEVRLQYISLGHLIISQQ